MTDRIDVARTHALASLEARGNGYISACINAICEHGRSYLVWGQRRSRFARACGGRAAFNLGSFNEATLNQKPHLPPEPLLLVGHAQGFGWAGKVSGMKPRAGFALSPRPHSDF